MITATFLVAMVRGPEAASPLEARVWILFGAAAIPSVPLWQWLGLRIGVMRAFAAAAILEAAGVAASVAVPVAAPAPMPRRCSSGAPSWA